MTGSLFNDWLVRFDRHFKMQGRQVPLLIDNCSGKCSKETLPELTNSEILFLPPNITSKLQPCDAGIIDAMKVSYRSFQLEKSIGPSRTNGTFRYVQSRISSAMLALKRIWNELPNNAILNCWMHTGLLDCHNVCEVPQSEGVALEDQCKIRSLIDDVVPTTCRVSIEDFLNPEG